MIRMQKKVVILLFLMITLFFYCSDSFKYIRYDGIIDEKISYSDSDYLGQGKFLKFLSSLNQDIEDDFYHSRFSKTTNENIIIVGIDDNSLDKIGKWPWDRMIYGDLIEKIEAGKPSAIGIDIIFSEKSSNSYSDEYLSEVLSKYDNIVVPSYGVFNDYTVEGEISVKQMINPVELFRKDSVQGHINIIVDEDGIVRQPLFRYYYENQAFDSFAYQLFKINSGKEDQEYEENKWSTRYIKFSGSTDTFENVSFYDVLSGEVPGSYFEGKIVLIGPFTRGLQDSYYTSADKQRVMYGVEIHANIIKNMIDKSFVEKLSGYIDFMILIGIAFLGYLILKIKNVMIATVSFATSYVSITSLSVLIYDRGYIINIFYPMLLLTFIAIYYLISKYMLEIFEKRKITNMFSRYVAPQIVKEIIKEGSESIELGGSRREISVLFVDIRGFTTLSEKAEPEEIVEILNKYLDLCANSIFEYDGTLDKFIGDATMAIFNAPLFLEDHALKAVYAALKMKNGAIELQEELENLYGVKVQFGIGINTGYAVVGNIGCKARMDYTAIGDSVNTAARLESNSKAGQILISKSTYEQVRDRVIVESLGSIKVKGKERSIDIYEVKGKKINEKY